MNHKVVVLGATSKIAQEVGRLMAAQGSELLLVARNPQHLSAVAADLAARGSSAVNYICGDLADISSHPIMVNQIIAKMPEFDTIFLAYGTLGDQTRAEQSADYALSELTTNFTSAVSLLTRLSGFIKKGGCIAVITSVAGDRARRSNYIYGTAKGALSLFLQGLRSKMVAAGVRVLTIKPGPVSTPMTAHLPQTRVFSTPEKVARSIFDEIERGHSDVIYVPGYWRFIMTAISLIPESIAKRMKF